ncbi:hypothetical protein EHS25_000977 [Saitozyma podzolica]|uniref:4-hydroxy-2-oxoglutarate aldolase, mitochondrial n=1 Tax=Saitozyma podzolica TaxID=1890683 RepID=A0A427YH12_9TREE|nr:hypothetical protein EHS25_000977 [Saitozyma podzolica]
MTTNGTNGTNGASPRPKKLSPGVYCPTVTFFRATPGQELDLELNARHFEKLARAGLHGIVVQGSTAEAVSLTPEERKQLISLARDTWANIGNPGAIIAGTVGAQSTGEAIRLAQDAADAGADFILSLHPNYFPAAMTPEAIQGFFEDLADASPIPVIIYSYPGVTSGIVMDSDLILRLSAHPNIAGVKHTDHDVGKMCREMASTKKSPDFTILAGASDYLLGFVAVGAQGTITGTSNLAPRVCVKTWELAQNGPSPEATRLAGLIARGEWTIARGSITGQKYATIVAQGYPLEAAAARKPILPVSAATRAHVDSETADLIAEERKLEKEGYTGSALSQ